MFPSSLAVAAPFALSVALVAQGGSAQDVSAGAARANATRVLPAGVVLGGGVVPIHTANDDPDLGPYGVWAAADGYKVGFHGDMTFIPYLGSEYPENQPLSWKTVSVRLGNRELMGAGERPARWHSETRYEYRYEAFAEAYDVLEEGLEQSFVIPRRPGGSGDLVVVGRLDTPMETAAVAGRHQELVFADTRGRELVRYGAAFVIDAAGRRCEIPTSCDGATVRLTVPGGWLEEAEFPVTIDPLLQGVLMFRNTLRIVSLDIARDDNNNQLMVVAALATSQSDYDVYGMLYQDDFSGRVTVFSDVSNTWSSPHVRVASSGTFQHWCIAFERRTATSRRVAYHIHSGGNFNPSTFFQTLSTGLFNSLHHWRPDVGGTIETAPGGFVIVCQQESVGPGNPFQNTNTSTIRGTVLDSGGVVQHTVTLQPAVSGADMERPTINQNARNRFGGSTWWMVAWQEYRSSLISGSRWALAGRQVGSNGTASSVAWQESGSGNQRLGPVLDGMDGRYLLAYTQSPTSLVPGRTTGIHGNRVMTKRVDWPPGSSGITDRPEQVLRSSGTRSLLIGGCAHDHDTDSHWAITSHGDVNAGGSGDVHIERVGFNGRVTESQSLVTGHSRSSAGGVTYDADTDQFATVFTHDLPPLGGYLVSGIRFTYLTPRPPTIFGTSCSLGGIAWLGSSQIGSEFPGVRLTSRSANQPAFLLVATQTSNTSLAPFGMTGCSLLVANGGPGYLGMVFTSTDAGGTAFQQISLPEFLDTGFVYFQWFHGAPGANAIGIQSTSRLGIQIIK